MEGDDRRRERRARTLSSAVHIVEVAEPDLAFEPRPWQFAQTHAEAVATRWARLRREKPEVYNGRVLLMLIPIGFRAAVFWSMLITLAGSKKSQDCF